MRDALDGRLLPQQRRAATRLNIDRITRALDLIVSFATTFTQAVDAADAFTNQLQELTSNSHYLPRFLDRVAAYVMTISRHIRRLTTTLPVASRPTTLQLFLPRSVPRTDRLMPFAPSSTDPLS